MALKPLYGHDKLKGGLAASIAAGRFPQSALLLGPTGIGKQRLALWAAQALLCAQRTRVGPCGSCHSCRQVQVLGHPDLHWFIPTSRPKASEPERQAREAEEALATVLDDRRRTGIWSRPEGLVAHHLASIRHFQRVVHRTPFAAPRKVLILGDAEWLVVQEASLEAANALLKALEEPPADTTIILTAADAHQLLPTVRSRLTTIRVPRLVDDAVRRFLATELEPPLSGDALERRVVLAEGSIGRALAGDTGSGGDAGERLLAALREGAAGWLRMALAQPPWAARGVFTASLDGMTVRLRAELARDASGDGRAVSRRLEALRALERARADARGNVNPQLVLAALSREIDALV